MIIVSITDEFNTTWEFKTNDAEEASAVVNDWLLSKDETPIYEINIQIVE